MTKENNTNELIKACLAKNEAAEFELYNRYCQAMYSITVRMLGNNEDAEDALQDAFVKAFKYLKKFDGRVTFGAWLKRITINICLNKLRKKKLKWLELDIVAMGFDIPDLETPNELHIQPEDLNLAIEKLPSGCKAIFILKAFEGFTHQEIAKQLKISLSTSKSQFVRAKELLRFSLKKWKQL